MSKSRCDSLRRRVGLAVFYGLCHQQ